MNGDELRPMSYRLFSIINRYALGTLPYALFSLFVILSPFASWGQSPPGKADRSAALVFSSNVYGEIEPCG